MKYSFSRILHSSFLKSDTLPPQLGKWIVQTLCCTRETSTKEYKLYDFIFMKFKDKHNYASGNQNTGYHCAGIRSSLDWEGTQGNFLEFEEFFFFLRNVLNPDLVLVIQVCIYVCVCLCLMTGTLKISVFYKKNTNKMYVKGKNLKNTERYKEEKKTCKHKNDY